MIDEQSIGRVIWGFLEDLVTRNLKRLWRVIRLVPSVPGRIARYWRWRRLRPTVEAKKKLFGPNTWTKGGGIIGRWLDVKGVSVPMTWTGRHPHQKTFIDFSNSEMVITQRPGRDKAVYVLEFDPDEDQRKRWSLRRGGRISRDFGWGWNVKNHPDEVGPDLAKNFKWEIRGIRVRFGDIYERKMPKIKGERIGPY